MMKPFVKTKIKQLITNYLLVAACITAAMGVIGTVLQPEVKLSHRHFFTPFLFAAVSMLPSVAFYSRRLLTKRQMIFRMFLHLFLLEAAVLMFAYFAGVLTGLAVTVAIAASVLVIDGAVTALTMVNTNNVAISFNEALKKMQEKDNFPVL